MEVKQFSPTDFEPIELHDCIHDRIRVEPMYFNLGFSPHSAVYARKVVLNSLLKALEILPITVGFHIWDAYRPRAVQATLFSWMREEIRKKMPHLSDEENKMEARKYMSPPSVIGEDYCPPHLSGGAIDLTLFEIETGCILEMGTSFDECSERAHRDYFQNQKHLTIEESSIKEHRQLLSSVMQEVGFTTYEYEWWHFDMGDLFWGRILDRPAVFGPLFGDEEW